jgi:hypothetical protein
VGTSPPRPARVRVGSEPAKQDKEQINASVGKVRAVSAAPLSRDDKRFHVDKRDAS